MTGRSLYTHSWDKGTSIQFLNAQCSLLFHWTTSLGEAHGCKVEFRRQTCTEIIIRCPVPRNWTCQKCRITGPILNLSKEFCVSTGGSTHTFMFEKHRLVKTFTFSGKMKTDLRSQHAAFSMPLFLTNQNICESRSGNLRTSLEGTLPLPASTSPLLSHV